MMDDVKDYPPYLDYPKQRKTTTNGDRIRAMSDEEICTLLMAAIPCESIRDIGKHCIEYDCESCIKEWLQQPAKEDS